MKSSPTPLLTKLMPPMSQETRQSSKLWLEPNERISEVLFGLIMVLTFTGSLSVADAGRDDVRAMLVGALGCNLAWGVIDGIFYLFFRMADVGLDRALLLALDRATDVEEGRRLIAEAVPPSVASSLDADDL